MLKTYHFKTHIALRHSSKTANIILPGLMIKQRRPYVCKRNIVGNLSEMSFIVSTNIMQFNEFEYHFACRRKDVHLCFIMSPGKMIFSVLEL